MGYSRKRNKIAIYLIQNGAHGVYIGQSISPEERWLNHLRDLKLNRHSNIYLQNAFNKHGQKEFTCEVVEEYEQQEDANKSERFYTDYLQFLGAKLYNLRPGGDVIIMSLESRKKIGDALRGRKGKPRTEEEKNHLSELWKGKPRPPEVIAKISAGHRGKKWSPERRARRSAWMKTDPSGIKQTQLWRSRNPYKRSGESKHKTRLSILKRIPQIREQARSQFRIAGRFANKPCSLPAICVT